MLKGKETMYLHKDLHMNFQDSSFVIFPNWKLPKCPLTIEWIHDLWYILTMKYYLAMKRDELMIHMTTNMSLIMLNERSLDKKERILYYSICIKF